MNRLTGRNPPGPLSLDGLDNFTHQNSPAMVTQARATKTPRHAGRERHDVDERIVIVGKQKKITDAQTPRSGGDLIGRQPQRVRVGSVASHNVDLHATPPRVPRFAKDNFASKRAAFAANRAGRRRAFASGEYTRASRSTARRSANGAST